MYRDFILNRRDKEKTLALVEKLYANLLIDWECHKKSVLNNRMRKTLASEIDRKYRIKIKATEVVLHHLGSDLFKDVKDYPSIRKTNTVNPRYDFVAKRQRSLSRY